jgi:general secretion pathway protein A
MARKIHTPFSTSANPTNLLLTPEVENALGRAKYVIDARQGLTAILGDVGLGKTSILRNLWMDYSAQEDAVVCMIPTPDFPSSYGLLKAICAEFKVSGKRSKQEQLQAFNRYVQVCDENDCTVIVMIDEAQRLDHDKLELIRTLLNYEKPDEKLVQIVLCGQLELRDKLIEKENEAIYNRVCAPTVLNPLTSPDTANLIEFRCRKAQVKNPFTDEAMSLIHKLTSGVPRSILSLCGQCYELMVRGKERTIEADLVTEVFGQGDLKGVLKHVA